MKTWLKFTAAASLVLAAAPAVKAQNTCSRPGPGLSGTCTFDSTLANAAGTKLTGVLLYQFSAGGHNQNGLNNSLIRLSNRFGFKLDRSGNNSSYVTASTLAGVDVVIANQTDKDPFENSTSLTAIKNFVEVQGKALWMNHAAAAYIPCPSEDLTNSGCRWALRTVRTQFWIHNPPETRSRIFADTVSVGQIPVNATGSSAVPATRNHGLKNDETRNIFSNTLAGSFKNITAANVASNLPANGGNGSTAGSIPTSTISWDGVQDEWYNYRNNPRLEGERVLDGVTFGPINILVSLDEAAQPNNVGCSDGSNCKNKGTFGDRPVAWTRKVGNGNALYQNAGHQDIYLTSRTLVGGGTSADTLIEKLNWRFLKYLARDFQGCMLSNYAEYNPDATVEVLNPIDTATVPVNTTLGRRSPCITQTGSAIHGMSAKAIPGIKVTVSGIMVPTTEAGTHSIVVTTLGGRQVFARKVTGGASKSITVPSLSKGTYMVRVTTPKSGIRVSKITLG